MCGLMMYRALAEGASLLKGVIILPRCCWLLATAERERERGHCREANESSLLPCEVTRIGIDDGHCRF